MKEYITVLEDSVAEYSEKRSRFIAKVSFCDSEEMASEIIAQAKSKYWDARHNVYAYLLSDGTARFSDDGEPHGTGGKPILDVIKGSKVVDVIIVVTRYFGGVLLGTGGLVRAYSTSAKDALENAVKAKMCPSMEYRVKCSYSDHQRLNSVIENNGGKITDVKFTDTVEVLFDIQSSNADAFEQNLRTTFSSQITAEKIKEKYSAIKI